MKQSRAMTRRARAVLATACGAHFIHDGFSDILYILLPVWATEFGLSFAQVGLLKTLYTGGMASFQLPAGLLAERRGEARLLAAGTAVTALGFLAAGLTGGFLALIVCLAVAGMGSGCQHPLSSSLVAKAYDAAGNTTTSAPVSFNVNNVVDAADEVEPNNTISAANAVGSRNQLTGFIGIAQASGTMAREGAGALFTFMAMLSMNLAILNLLPIPMLDGGHIFIMLLEGVARRDFSLRVKERLLMAGFVLVMTLMVTVIYNDLMRIDWIQNLVPWK